MNRSSLVLKTFIVGSMLVFKATDGVAAVDQAITHNPPTDRLWAFHAGVEQLKLHGDRGNDIVGKAGQFGFGLSEFLSDHWMVQGTVDIHAGPWHPIRDSSFNSDFSGTGVTLESMHSLTGSNLRSGSTSWVGILGLCYVDLTGRSIGPNRHELSDPNARENYFLERNYQINVNALWFNPGIEYLFMQSPRFTGNTPELLATRVEGYSLRIAAGIPVSATYHARILRRDESQTTDQTPQEVSDKGRLRGYSVITSLHTWLGT